MHLAIPRRRVIEVCANNLIKAGIIGNNRVEREDVIAMLETMSDHELTSVLFESNKQAEQCPNPVYVIGELCPN